MKIQPFLVPVAFVKTSCVFPIDSSIFDSPLIFQGDFVGMYHGFVACRTYYGSS